MYAVIATGGKQYSVETGEVVRIEKVTGEKGDTVTFDKVLVVRDADDIAVGTPFLPARVTGRIVSQGKAKKVVIGKMKRRKKYRRKMGHRQSVTDVLITDIAKDKE